MHFKFKLRALNLAYFLQLGQSFYTGIRLFEMLFKAKNRLHSHDDDGDIVSPCGSCTDGHLLHDTRRID